MSAAALINRQRDTALMAGRNLRRLEGDLDNLIKAAEGIGSLNAFRNNRGWRGALVALTLAAWLVLSNHCALAALWTDSPAQQPATTCGCTPAPEKSPERPKPASECCKTLQAKMPEASKFAGPPVQAILLVVLEWTHAAKSVAAQESALERWTGPPPRVATFSQLVLQRSLRSHAPPFSA